MLIIKGNDSKDHTHTHTHSHRCKRC